MIRRIITGLFIYSVAAILLNLVGRTATKPQTAQLINWQNAALFTLPKPDPVAEAVMHQYLKIWQTTGGIPANQGIWIQTSSGLNLLAENQGTVALPAASLTKIATSLASLNKWGPDYQFETIISATGAINNGVLQGDLVIIGSGDPLFVWEEGIAVGNSLSQLGIRQVTGSLIIVGDFYMNFQKNPAMAGAFFRQGINAKTWSRGFTFKHATMAKGTPKPQIAIAGTVKLASTPPPNAYFLLRHQSPRMTQILREMNIHSSNDMAEMLGKSLGGASVVVEEVIKSTGISPTEIQLINTSGLGMENKISPHAATTMLIAINKYLEPFQLNIADVFPLSGRDKNGTMHGRKMPLGTAMKTGTLREVSALAGAIPTRDRGLVWFAIINRGNDIPKFRAQQDEILSKLTQQWGNLPTFNPDISQPAGILGDSERIQQ
ncbi:MAG TPA: D-alanyl-D-alanine carboxypeptidase [Cyanobacteria bacterium UBA11149]|nr:D-alanyl-D-alanine carboxypeptidase [Cyanobacteria bacterium UBA11367]HBE60703.1 D-alanyl-D-alanine carboxypeptidase [Cyanobacteria bacterium UBA11366]HBR74499.1 D-alanyl-D-alanine carboxypeptidase [Cyanobacteria bacterium UBA11159]HBS68297.1 D-alanyl-D-alanine carboxypeptidase [Cyanobacteria bacterium UBA11153]HBW91362.1 D-alanyl-D-alanine carboxypeptidase [Cyanobacteria bacterium UBA11149]HCA93603.1 D-alanyl-D-alanine carboxypeptidase [Cyanobacteria bacterium UBA9226]